MFMTFRMPKIITARKRSVRDMKTNVIEPWIVIEPWEDEILDFFYEILCEENNERNKEERFPM